MWSGSVSAGAAGPRWVKSTWKKQVFLPFPTKKCDCSLALLCYKEFKLSERRICHLQTFWRCYMWWCKKCSRHIQPGPSCTSQQNVSRKYLLRSVKWCCSGLPITAVRSEQLSQLYRLLCHHVSSGITYVFQCKNVMLYREPRIKYRIKIED